MRVLVSVCVALASCFGPTVGDGSFLCEDGLECPEGMFCRTDCSPRRCYFDPTAACTADAGVVVDSPQPIADSAPPVFDGPVVAVDSRSPLKDASLVVADALLSPLDAVAISTDALINLDVCLVDCAPCDCPGVVYPTDRTHSPITKQVVAAIQTIVTNGPTRNEHIYVKVGDSNSANGGFLRCFDTPDEPPPYDLGLYPELQTTIDWFRYSHIGFGPACLAGATASELITGNPSPLAQVLVPPGGRYAVIMLGTNQEPLDVFEASMRSIVAQSIAAGVVPILSTIPDCLPCLLKPNTPFNDIVRKIAEDNLIPLVDLRRETQPLPSFGLVDGIHLSTINRGGDLTPAGLQYGFDRRNLLTLQALARAKLAVEGIASDPGGCDCPKCLQLCPSDAR